MIKSMPRTSHVTKGVNLEEVEAAWEAWNSESGWQPHNSVWKVKVIDESNMHIYKFIYYIREQESLNIHNQNNY